MKARSREVLPVDDSIGYQVRQVSRALENSLRERLAGHKIPFGMWFYLRVLWNEDGLSQATLARRVGATRATTTVQLQRMEEQGLIRRSASATNRKIVEVYLTRYGRSLAERLLREAAANNRDALAGVLETDVAATLRTLRLITANFKKKEA